MYKIMFTLIIIAFTTPVYADYFQGFECNQDFSADDNLEVENIKGFRLNFVAYKKENDSIKIGDVKSELISYIFWNNKFYGINIGMIGKENINKVLRYFQKQYKVFTKTKPKGQLVWLTDDLIILLDRYSTNMAEVKVACRELAEKRSGRRFGPLKEEEKE